MGHRGQEGKAMGRIVCFHGVLSSELEHRQREQQLPENSEIWVVNEAHRSLAAGVIPNRVFQLHVRDWREAERRYLYSNGKDLPPSCDPDCFGRNKEHVAYLRTCGVPVYGQQWWPDIPTSIRYPFEWVTATVGVSLPPSGRKRLWATSSFGYMAALLLTEHLNSAPVDELIIIGCELPLGTGRERTWEWPNFAYYLGLAKGLGIKITLPAMGSSLLSAPHYALDGHPFPGESDHWLWPGPAIVVDDDGVYRLGQISYPARLESEVL